MRSNHSRRSRLLAERRPDRRRRPDRGRLRQLVEVVVVHHHGGTVGLGIDGHDDGSAAVGGTVPPEPSTAPVRPSRPTSPRTPSRPSTRPTPA